MATKVDFHQETKDSSTDSSPPILLKNRQELAIPNPTTMDKARVALERLDNVTAVFLDPKKGITLLLAEENLSTGENLTAVLAPDKIMIGEIETLDQLPC